MGICLVWLCDILKNRPIQRNGNFVTRWLTGFFSSTNPASHIPVDQQALHLFFQRAARRHDSYVRENRDKDHLFFWSPDVVMVKYKNYRQLLKETQTGVLGLEYKFRTLNNLFCSSELGFSSRMQGNIIGLFFPDTGERHAVAQITYSPGETYLLDPNVGLYKLSGKSIALEISEALPRIYVNPRVESQITIRRKC